MKKVACLTLASIFFTACGPSQSEYNALKTENEALKSELSACKIEIENYKNTPDKLHAQAITLIENKDIQGLQEICEKFQKYHPSSPEYNKVKTALDKIVAEKTAREKAEKEKRMQAVNKLKKRYDDVSGITWYYNPYYTHYTNSNHTSIYMGKESNGKPWLRLLMSYYGDSWIFFDRAYLSYDGTTKEIHFDEYRDKKTENDTDCWEWIDVRVDESILSFLKEMVNGKSVKMRLTGKYSKTRELNSTEIKAIKDVLLGYDVLMNGE